MSGTARRDALWHGLGIGPLWRRRRGADSVSIAVPARPGATVAPAVDRADVDSVAAASNGAVTAVPTMDWGQLEQAVQACAACALCRTRTQTVFGVGDRSARWMLIGEAPGAEEDARGEPFVGQAGRLLDQMLAAVGLSRTAQGDGSVYIANVLKCRPPANRNPEPEEVARCEPFLRRQIALVAPGLLLVMGRFAAQSLLGTDASIASLRGRVHRYDADGRGIPVVVTYHPAYLLRSLADKSKSWADLCLARDVVEGRIR